MKRILLVVAISMTLSACSDERLYQILGSPPPQGPPTIYPMNFPVCPSSWGIVVIPLKIIVHHDSFPNPERAMMLMKKYPNKDVCSVIRERNPEHSHDFEKNDYWNAVAGFDKSGNGYFAASTYEFNLISDESRRERERKERNYKEFQEKKMLRDGFASKDFVESEEVLIINGLKWHHQVRVGYREITSFDPKHPRDINKRTGLYDRYEHQFDKSHTFQFEGGYNKIILDRPELLKDRRQLTRRLVEGFRYERISPKQIERLKGPKG